MALGVDHVAVEAYGRTSLRLVRRQLVHLPRRLVDERQEAVERHAALLHHVGCQRIAMVGKVACKHCRKMQITARGGVEQSHIVTHTRGKTLKSVQSIRVARLKKHGDD